MNQREIINKNWPYPAWIAHRGGGIIAPENTLKGFQLAHQLGFRGVEFDVKLTKDKQSVVIHDDDLIRVAGINQKVRDLTLAEIIKIDASINYPQYSPAFVPSFKEIADFCLKNQVMANVEIKPCVDRDEETARIVAENALEYWKNSIVPPLFSSFSIKSLKVLQKLYPDSIRGLLIEDWLLSDEEMIHLMTDLDCVSLHADEKDLTEERVAKIKEKGFMMIAWTVNDFKRAQDLLSWGVDGIITDLIKTLPLNLK